MSEQSDKEEVSEGQPPKIEERFIPENTPESSPEISPHELGRNFFCLVMNYYKFELMNFYIKPKMPFERGPHVPIEE